MYKVPNPRPRGGGWGGNVCRNPTGTAPCTCQQAGGATTSPPQKVHVRLGPLEQRENLRQGLGGRWLTWGAGLMAQEAERDQEGGKAAHRELYL